MPTLYKTLHNSAQLYTILQHSTLFYTNYKTIQNFSKPLHNFSKPQSLQHFYKTQHTFYDTLQIQSQLYKTRQQCSSKALQHLTKKTLHTNHRHTKLLKTIQNSTKQNFTNTSHNCTILIKPKQSFQISTKLYNNLHSITKLYTTICRTLQNFRKLV